MVMSVCGYAQKYEVGTTTAVWKAPAAADFLHAKAIGVKYVEVAFNQCYRGVPVEPDSSACPRQYPSPRPAGS